MTTLLTYMKIKCKKDYYKDDELVFIAGENYYIKNKRFIEDYINIDNYSRLKDYFYVTKLKYEYETKEERKERKEKKIKIKEERKERKKENNKRKERKGLNTYILTNPNGVEYETDNIYQFSLDYDLSHSHLISVAKGRRNHHKGWNCRFKGQEKTNNRQKIRNIYIVTDPNGKEYETNNITAFAKEKGLWHSHLINIAKGKKGCFYHKGWKCRFKNNKINEEET